MSTSQTVFYAAGEIEGGDFSLVDMAEEWEMPATDIPELLYGRETAEEMREAWTRAQARFRYSHAGTKLLRVTVTVEAVDDLE